MKKIADLTEEELARLDELAGQMQDWMDEVMEQRVKLKVGHLESMFVAYMSATDIDPRDVVLVEETVENAIFYYYAHKNKLRAICECTRCGNESTFVEAGPVIEPRPDNVRWDMDETVH